MDERFGARFDERIARRITEYTKHAPYSRLLGIEVVEVTPGRIVCRIASTDPLASGVGPIHGGAIASLIDHSLSLAVYPLVPFGRWVATREFSVRYMAPARGAELVARGEVLELDDDVGSVRVDVYVGDKQVATATGKVVVTAPIAPKA